MGRKGVSKRKPKKDRPFSPADIGGAANTRSGDRSQVLSLVKDKGAPLQRDVVQPAAGSKKNRKTR
jgi:hypothetical protein